MTTFFLLVMFSGISVELYELSRRERSRRKFAERLGELNKIKEKNDEQKLERNDVFSKTCMVVILDFTSLIALVYLASSQICLVPVIVILVLSVLNVVRKNSKTDWWFYIDRPVSIICYGWIAYHLITQGMT